MGPNSIMVVDMKGLRIPKFRPMEPPKGLGLPFTLRVLTNWGTSKLRVSETPKRPKGSP